MTTPPDQDKCGECGESLPCIDLRPAGTPKTPCPSCGSTKRIKSAEMHARVTVSVTADAQLIISWQEVDRLLAKAEYAAALLVAAVNVEFILWENLRRFTPSPALRKAPNDINSVWGQIRANRREKVTLGSLLRVTEFLGNHDKLLLLPTWDPLVRFINEVRGKIAHERGYFAKLTQLKEADWPETRIRQVLEDVKEFCHGNAP